MKNLSLILIAAFILLMITACGNSAEDTSASNDGSSETYEIKIHNGLQEDSALHEALIKFKEEAEEKSDGQLQVEVFSGGTLYTSDVTSVEAVQAGDIEMSAPGAAALSGFTQDFMVLDFMFLFDGIEDARAALDGELGEKLFESLPPIGLRGLGWGEAGMRQITNSIRPVETPEDLKGIDFRVQENSLYIDSFNALGANASPFAYGELYSALQQNIYDGQENPFNLIHKDHFYEVQDYLTISNHAYNCEPLLINNDFYNSLPEPLQEVLDEAGNNFTENIRNLAAEEVEQSFEVIKEHLEVTELSSEQKEKFSKLLEPVFKEYEKDLGELVEIAKSYN